MSFRKILCPIDFSPGAEQAMRVAVRLAKESDAELVIAHAWYLPPGAYEAGYAFGPALLQQITVDAQNGLDAALRQATSLGAKRVSARLLSGGPWNAIVEALEDPEFELVVIGSHGRSGLSRLLLGSVAEMVVRHAPCSVLAVPLDGEPKPFSHALCPVDFSESSQYAQELATKLVRPSGGKITLLHAVEIPVAASGEPVADFARDLDKRSADLLDKWAARLGERTGLPVKARARIGRPRVETLAMLDDDSTIDLVVMGSHGRTGVRRAVMGSVAEKVVRHARCPVLVARKRAVAVTS